MTELLAAMTGVGLAACAGLRAFLPLFAIGLASRALDWPLAPALAWLSSDPALIIFGAATVLEILADKIPVVDNALDGVQTILAPIAGGLVSFSPFFDLSPTWAVPLAIMGGASIAGGVHMLAATSRIKSTAFTAGVANPVLSVLEDVMAAASAVFAILAPIVVLLVVVAGGYLLWRVMRRRRRILAPAITKAAGRP
jgi:hypothetical protein